MSAFHTEAALPGVPPQGWLELHRDSHGPRRRPRIAVELPVHLSGAWNDQGSGAYVPVLARCCNLGEGGMAVASPVLLDLGSVVTCSLRVDGLPVYLQGRVAWRRSVGRRAGAKLLGIEFITASDPDLLTVRRMLSRVSDRQLVELRFDGLAEPVFAQAQVEGTDLRLAAPLSLLQLGSGVRFRFGQGPQYQGSLADVDLSLRGQTPVLTARVAVDACQRSTFREHSQRIVTEGNAAADVRSERKWLAPVLWAGAFGLACGTAMGTFDDGGLLQIAVSGRAVEPAVVAGAPDRPVASALPDTRGGAGHVAARLAAPNLDGDANSAAGGAAHAAGKRLPGLADGASGLRGATDGPRVGRGAGAGSVGSAATGGWARLTPESHGRTGELAATEHGKLSRIFGTDGPVSAAGPDSGPDSGKVPDEPLDPRPAPGHAFEIRRHRSTVEVDLPALELPRVLRKFRMASPPGIGLDLADALALAPGKYPINKHGLLWLRVVDRADGTRVRLFLKRPPTHYGIESMERELRLFLARR